MMIVQQKYKFRQTSVILSSARRQNNDSPFEKLRAKGTSLQRKKAGLYQYSIKARTKIFRI